MKYLDSRKKNYWWGKFGNDLSNFHLLSSKARLNLLIPTTVNCRLLTHHRANRETNFLEWFCSVAHVIAQLLQELTKDKVNASKHRFTDLSSTIMFFLLELFSI